MIRKPRDYSGDLQGFVVIHDRNFAKLGDTSAITF